MKAFMLLFRVMLFVILVLLLLSLGIRLLHLGAKFWYISVPVLILVYFLVSQTVKKKKENSGFFHSSVDPHKEVKPEKDPEVTNLDNNDNQDTSGSSGSSAK